MYAANDSLGQENCREQEVEGGKILAFYHSMYEFES